MEDLYAGFYAGQLRKVRQPVAPLELHLRKRKGGKKGMEVVYRLTINGQSAVFRKLRRPELPKIALM